MLHVCVCAHTPAPPEAAGGWWGVSLSSGNQFICAARMSQRKVELVQFYYSIVTGRSKSSVLPV